MTPVRDDPSELFIHVFATNFSFVLVAGLSLDLDARPSCILELSLALDIFLAFVLRTVRFSGAAPNAPFGSPA